MKKSRESIEKTRETEEEMKFIDDYMTVEEYKSFVKEDTEPILEFIEKLGKDLKEKTGKDFLEAPQDWLKRFPERLIDEFSKKQEHRDIRIFILDGQHIVRNVATGIGSAINLSPELSGEHQVKDVKARALLHELDMVGSYIEAGQSEPMNVNKSRKFNSSLRAIVDAFLEVGYRFEMRNAKFKEIEEEGAEYDKFEKTYYRYLNPALFLRSLDDKYFKWTPSCVEKLDITFPKELAKEYRPHKIDEPFFDNVRTISDFYLAKAIEQGKKVEVKIDAEGSLKLIGDVELSPEEKSFVKHFEEVAEEKLILEK